MAFGGTGYAVCEDTFLQRLSGYARRSQLSDSHWNRQEWRFMRGKEILAHQVGLESRENVSSKMIL